MLRTPDIRPARQRAARPALPRPLSCNRVRNEGALEQVLLRCNPEKWAPRLSDEVASARVALGRRADVEGTDRWLHR
jgi:hypothetical protein